MLHRKQLYWNGTLAIRKRSDRWKRSHQPHAARDAEAEKPKAMRMRRLMKPFIMVVRVTICLRGPSSLFQFFSIPRLVYKANIVRLGLTILPTTEPIKLDGW